VRFQGHTLTAVYLPGSTFTIKSGRVVPRKPTRKDIDYVLAEPDDGGTRVRFSSFSEAKAFIKELKRHEQPS